MPDDPAVPTDVYAELAKPAPEQPAGAGGPDDEQASTTCLADLLCDDGSIADVR